jgi:hypothetical protein
MNVISAALGTTSQSSLDKDTAKESQVTMAMKSQSAAARDLFVGGDSQLL